MCDKHEPNAFSAFAKSKCPRCRSGKVFTHPFYNLKNFLSFNTHCPVCGVKFEKETGFFWTAMYISYGINVALAVTIGISLNLFFDDPSIEMYMYTILGVVVLGSTLIFRYSRIIALYSFSGLKYDKDAVKKR